MKKISIFLFFILYISLFSIEIKDNKAIDSFGNSIPLKEYKKIIVADPAAVEIFYLLGGEDKIVAIAGTKINKIYPEEKTKYLKSVGSITKPSIEKILSFDPDLIILNPMASEIIPFLKRYNIPYFIDRSVTFDEIFEKTKIYGIFSGKNLEAQKIIDEKKEKLNSIRKKVEEKPFNYKGVVLYSYSPMTAFAENTIPSQILKLLNIENIADFSKGKRILSSEFILEKNPDIIIGTMKIKSPHDIIKNNEFLKYSNAYKNNKIYIFESDKILRATPKIADGIEEIYEVLSNEQN